MKTRSYSFTIFFLFIFSVLIPHSSMANILRLEKWNFKKYSSTLEGPWTEISDRKSKDFKGEGTRFEKGLKTYQLLISLPKYLENEEFSLLIPPSIFSAYELSLKSGDSEFFASVGKIGKDHQTEAPWLIQRKINFKIKPGGTFLKIRIKVSNFSAPKGGFFQYPILGLRDVLDSEEFKEELIIHVSYWLVNFLFLINLCLAIFRRTEKEFETLTIFLFVLSGFPTLVSSIWSNWFDPNFFPQFFHFSLFWPYFMMTVLPFFWLRFITKSITSISGKDINFRMYWALFIWSLLFFLWPLEGIELYAYGSFFLGQAFLILTFNSLLKSQKMLGFSFRNNAFIGILTTFFLSFYLLLMFLNCWAWINLETYYFLAAPIAILPNLITGRKLYDIFSYSKSLNFRLKKEVKKRSILLKKETKTVLTTKRRMQESYDNLLQAICLKDSFFQNVSYKLRTLLTLIIGHFDFLKQKSNLPIGTKDWVEMLDQNCRIMDSLLNQLVHFQDSRTQLNQIKLDPINLSEEIKKASALFKLKFNEQAIKLRLTGTENELWVLADSEGVQKIIRNYLSNAVKYSPKGGLVKVSLVQQGERAVVEVFDNGKPIDPSFRLKLFKRWSQNEKRESSKDQGSSGLGLAVCHDLAFEMNGSVDYEEKDGGNCFSMALPILNVIPKVVKMRERDITRSGFSDPGFNFSDLLPTSFTKNSLVLVCEDQEETQKLLKRLFEASGYKVITAKNGEQGLNLSLKKIPDLIVTDLKMPIMDGLELIHLIRANEKLKGIPIIVLTAHTIEENRIASEEAGSDAFISKPFDSLELITHARNLLSLKRKERQFSKELSMASKLQAVAHKSLSGEYLGFSLSSYFLSSIEVGGDLMLVKQLSEDDLFVAQCDICGHGAQASLLSFYLRGILELSLEDIKHLPPSELLVALCKSLDYQFVNKIGDSYFSTFAFVILSKSKKSCIYLSGGHPPGIFMDQKGSKVLISDRPPLGISMADLIPYEPRVLNAEGSFRLLIASDSISELPGEHFNRTILGHRLFAQLSKDYLKRSWQHTSADDYVEFMLSTSKNKRFEDDCSVLILQG